ncbi:MAG: carboxylesterase family protein, partial [Acetobacteraceae bacterium]|nr:carboxylesterase family protein [Acetobacteraceae bacterium]
NNGRTATQTPFNSGGSVPSLVYDGSGRGNTCPQITELGVFAGPVSVTEDCLYLNVFTTRTAGAENAKWLPVLLWIHGGGLYDGESNDCDGSALAKGGPAGPTVVVTINYRLGLLGYLGHPALDSEGHDFCNYGLMDQQEALRWTQRNNRGLRWSALKNRPVEQAGAGGPAGPGSGPPNYPEGT